MVQIIKNFIANKSIESNSTYDLLSPVDGTHTATVFEASEMDVEAAVDAARAALDGPWGAMSQEDRSALLHKVAAGITNRFDDFVEAEMADTGQPRHVMEHAFVPRGAANFEIFADVVKNVPTEAFQSTTPAGRQALNYAVRKPKGVIGVICPWNAPFLLMTWKVGPALAAGNCVVVKPSEQTPRTATLLGEVMAEVGVPEGVYNVVNGFGPGSAGEFLTTNPRVDAITFTGETVTGTAIMQAAAVGMRDVSLELGGKNSAVVFADADLNDAVDGVFRSAFMNTGQVCLGTEKVFVERPLYEAFVERLAEKAKAVVYGRPEDHSSTYGPLISKEHHKKVLGYYQLAVEDGATVVCGGSIPNVGDDLSGGCWVEPTIWTDLPADSALLSDEVFGPCCHIAPFDDADAVIAEVNNTPYGLASSIWTTNLSRAHNTADAIDVGICWVNSWFLRDLRTAFGGSKQSGIGREGGVHSLEFYTELRNICIQL